ncbi:hypothetical protein [Cryptosporangium sp. NPDC051539]|uniref:hypothetical protein n=1 Tax=Cryptosporangium sp. NPDC051539 TaxID=3363962 RepID=UPI0037AA0292
MTFGHALGLSSIGVATMAEDLHRRRERRRRNSAEAEEAPVRRVPDGPEADKVLRSLVGAGPSQLRPDAAMRARDASRPTDEDIADAEQNLVIVRRQYVPTETLPPGIRPAPTRPDP